MPVDCKKRPKDHYWSGIVIHHTGVGERDPEAISPSLWAKLAKNITAWLQKPDDVYVSAHYLITREGKINTILDPNHYIAYHAGLSQWWDIRARKIRTSCNYFMIGIELLGDGNLGHYSHEQYESLAKLCRTLMIRHSIVPNMIVGHEAVSPGRKNDPGQLFDWDRLFSLISK